MASADLLATAVRAGRRADVARALNLVEDRRPLARDDVAALLRALGDGRPGGRRVGLTGPPGVGKSTLVSAVAKHLRVHGRTVGVLAVDPSSVRSGGALLGDRVRMESDPTDEGLFIRSLATRGELGGLARAAPASALVLAAAYDDVLVETVGVGQSETDVEHVVDTVIFVVQPGSGDALQFLKAGIMEIPDVLAVNKGDLGLAAERARADVMGALGAARSAGVLGDWVPPVVLTSATRREGIDGLLAAVADHRAYVMAHEGLAARRVRGKVAWGVREFVRRVGEEGVARTGGMEAVRASVRARIEAGESPV